MVLQSFAKFYLFFMFAYPENFMCQLKRLKNLNIGGLVRKGPSHFGTTNICQILYFPLNLPTLKILLV